MSTTTTINPKDGNKPGGKKFASHAATAGAGAAMGAAGAAMAAEFMPETKVEEEKPIPENHEEEPSRPATQPQQENAATENNEDAAATVTVGASQPASETNEAENLEPEPITAETSGQPEEPETPEEVSENAEVSEEVSTPEEIVTPEEIETPEEVMTPEEVETPEEVPVEETSPEGATDTTITEEQAISPATEEEATEIMPDEVNPDEIAEAIIAEEQIDPADIDMADVIDFDEIGTVYTVGGESYTAASFHDSVGNQLVMVDVDDDGVFDIITDMEGNPITDGAGNYMAAGGMTVDDAELDVSDDGTYLAQSDGGTTENYGAESIGEDLINQS